MPTGGRLGRLPRELRDIIFGYVLESDIQAATHYHADGKKHTRLVVDRGQRTLRETLAPLQICQQIRHEAIETLSKVCFNLDHTVATFKDYHEHKTPIAPPTESEIEDWTQLISAFPAHLLIPGTIFEYQHVCGLQEPYPSMDDPIWGDKQGFNIQIRRLVEIVRPGKLKLSMRIYFRRSDVFTRLLESGDIDDMHLLNKRQNRGQTGYICKRDAVMTEETSQVLMVSMPADDPDKARSAIKTAFDGRRESFEAHRGHRVCFVRLYVNRALSRLAIAENMLLTMVSHLPSKEE